VGVVVELRVGGRVGVVEHITTHLWSGIEFMIFELWHGDARLGCDL
jgi:hypothetical protein